jgi:hypothetical protein
MKEIDNIQTPVKVDIRQILNTYGSHYTVKHNRDKKTLKPIFDFKLSIHEEIGEKDKHNEWAHQYATFEDAYKSACNTVEVIKRDTLTQYEEREASFSWKFHKLMSKLGLLSVQDNDELKEHASIVAQLKKDIDELKNKTAKFDVVLLSGEYNMPAYMPELGKTYYMLNINNLANVKLTPMKLIPEEVAIYDYRGSSSNDKFADQFDFKFSHYFEGPNGESTMIDSDRLVRFNGQYWNLGIMNYYLFVDEKEALEFAKKCAETKVAGMQAELIAIAESMAKL